MTRRHVSVGAVAASIIVACVGTKLSSVQQDNVVVQHPPGLATITMYQFGTVSGSATALFDVHPATTSDDDNIDSIAFTNPVACHDFTLTLGGGVLPLPQHICNGGSTTLGPSAMPLCLLSYPFSVTFTPQSVPAQSCNVEILSSHYIGGMSNTPVTLTLNGSGTGTPFDFSVVPSSPNNKLDFGSVPTGSLSSTRTITISNTGTMTIPIHVAEPATVYGFTPSGSDFTLNANAGSGSIQQIGVTCTPNLGSNDATVTVSSSATPLVRTVLLTCIGVNTTLTIMPNPVDFGTIIIPTPSEPTPMPAKVTNSAAGGSVTISSISLMGADPDVTIDPPAPSNITIPPGSNVTPVTVHYAASHEQAPGSLGTLVMMTSTGMLTYPITGGARTGSIGTNPASVDLGVVCTGRTASQNVGVYANGTADVTVDLHNPQTPPFTAMMTNGVVHGGHNGESTLVVGAAPTATDLGELKTQIELDTDIPMQAQYLLDVAAFGAAGGKTTATPTSVDFGQVTKDTTSSAKRIEFANCSGGANAMVTDATITGLDATAFKMFSPSPENIAKPLGDGESETFLIAMTPRALGKLSARLEITYSTGPVVTVPLAGEGIAPMTPRETYYACSVGDGAAAWPIGLALFALRRRRNRALR